MVNEFDIPILKDDQIENILIAMNYSFVIFRFNNQHLFLCSLNQIKFFFFHSFHLESSLGVRRVARNVALMPKNQIYIKLHSNKVCETSVTFIRFRGYTEFNVPISKKFHSNTCTHEILFFPIHSYVRIFIFNYIKQ